MNSQTIIPSPLAPAWHSVTALLLPNFLSRKYITMYLSATFALDSTL